MQTIFALFITLTVPVKSVIEIWLRVARGKKQYSFHRCCYLNTVVSENGHQWFSILEDFNSIQLTKLEKYTMQEAQMFDLIKRVDEMEEWTK